jgi:E3 ubiquitin-protein ligase BRE1
MIALNTYPGELEETAGDLELCRRKLATLRSQKDAAAAPPTPGSVQLGVKIEGGDRGSGTDKISREARELEAALEETKVQLMISCRLYSICISYL